jgi:transglutaminase-like putative cysteine protease
MPAQIPFGSFITPEYQLMANEPVNQLYRYSASSYPEYRLDAHDPPKARYVSLPAKAAPKAESLVRQWQAKSRRPEKIVKMALDYYKNQPFYYTRNPPLLDGNPIDQFLFQTRRGYCEHFAASFTVLMRLAGIPSRVVTGYYGGEINPISDYVIVRQSSAHAWAEVWLDERGWTRVDPTAVIPESRVENVDDLSRIQPLSRRVLLTTRLDWLGESMRQLDFLWDAVNNRWNQWVVGFNDEKQRDFMAWLGLEKAGSYALVVLLSLASALFIVFASLILMRPRRQKQTQVQRVYARFCKKMAKRGLPRENNEGAMDFALRVAQKFPSLKPAVFAIAEDYYQVRYADQPAAACVARMKLNLKQL